MSPGTIVGQKSLTALEKRFARFGLSGLSDREIVELLLRQSLPRRESKRTARKCLELFGNLRGLLSASGKELGEAGVSPRAILSIRLLHELPQEILREGLANSVLLSSSAELFEYLYYSMRDLKREVFKVVFLDNGDRLIDTMDLFEGMPGGINISPRRIVESAIAHNAPALIFVHNHPSGDVTPSRSDKRLTRDMVFIGNVLEIRVLDHIIIGENRYFSFADEGLIQKYNDQFLNLRMKAVF